MSYLGRERREKSSYSWDGVDLCFRSRGTILQFRVKLTLSLLYAYLCFLFQTIQPQYIFIHDALLESIECGVTDVPARDLRDQYRLLNMVDEYLGLTGLEIEYDKLDSTIHRQTTKTIGTLAVNKAKNRYANIDMIPCE